MTELSDILRDDTLTVDQRFSAIADMLEPAASEEARPGWSIGARVDEIRSAKAVLDKAWDERQVDPAEFPSSLGQYTEALAALTGDMRANEYELPVIVSICGSEPRLGEDATGAWSYSITFQREKRLGPVVIDDVPPAALYCVTCGTESPTSPPLADCAVCGADAFRATPPAEPEPEPEAAAADE